MREIINDPRNKVPDINEFDDTIVAVIYENVNTIRRNITLSLISNPMNTFYDPNQYILRGNLLPIPIGSEVNTWGDSENTISSSKLEALEHAFQIALIGHKSIEVYVLNDLNDLEGLTILYPELTTSKLYGTIAQAIATCSGYG